MVEKVKSFKAVVCTFADSPSCQELDEKIDTTLMSVC